MVTMSDGARHNDPSLCDPAKGEGLAKRDESSILRRWARLFLIGSSPSVKKPKVNSREEDASLP